MLAASDIREALQLPSNSHVQPEALAQEVIDLFESLTNRLWNYRAVYVQTIRPAKAQDTTLWLNLYPLTTVSVGEYWDVDGVTGIEATDVADYQLDKLRGRLILTRQEAFPTFTSPRWRENVQITMTGGYTTTTLPKNIRLALITQAKFMAARFSPTNIAVMHASVKGASTSFLQPDYHPLFQACAIENRREVY